MNNLYGYLMIFLSVAFTVLIFWIYNKCVHVFYFGVKGILMTIASCFGVGAVLSAITVYLLHKAIGAAAALLMKLLTLLLYGLTIVVIGIFIFIVVIAVYCLLHHVNPFSITETEYKDRFGENKQDKTAMDSFFGAVVGHIRQKPALAAIVVLATLVLTFYFGVMAFERYASNHRSPTERTNVEETYTSSQSIDNGPTSPAESYFPQQEEDDIDDSNISSVNLDINACEFDQFCGIWDSVDGNVQFKITASSAGYAVRAYVIPWDMVTRSWVFLDNERQEIPLTVCFLKNESDSVYGDLVLTPNMETGELEVAYSFDRQYADPSKSTITGQKQICKLVEKEDVPQNADFMQCLGVWNSPADDVFYYKLSKNEQSGQFELLIWDEVNEYFSPAPIILTEVENCLSAEFDLGDGVYGNISIIANRFNQMAIKNAVVYCNYGADFWINIHDQPLVATTSSEAESVYDNYFYGLCAAISWHDFELVSETMLPRSTIYQQQQELVQNLSSRGITENPIESEILLEQMSDWNHYEIYAREKISVKYTDGTIKEIEQSYIYILQRSDLLSSWMLVDMIEA